ncbi:uncharacterized protein LOC120201590 isoform X1 [Hibiscus syriacus]|uniref:uncharacterized protein LOC120201590 isoform X1 n=1 Tax=Hibiscus syriacus TaxID=106335 RepID=UPI001920C39B|nr:uncharacterized protein LOC120201590 isoform X1 [Hibiscus syriacus]
MYLYMILLEIPLLYLLFKLHYLIHFELIIYLVYVAAGANAVESIVNHCRSLNSLCSREQTPCSIVIFANVSNKQKKEVEELGVSLISWKEFSELVTCLNFHRLTFEGHSVMRKLNSDGRVDTIQTLHNLNEDELTCFEESWNGKAQKYLPVWSESFIGHDTIGANSSG